MLKRFLVLVMLAGLVFFSASGVAAQASYSFSLDKEITNAYWNADGTLAVDYLFTFTNDPGAHIIDFVDVGMPNSSFARDTITADVGGQPLVISSDY